MSLREAKKCKIGDKVKLKDTGKVVTVTDVLFIMGGIGYPTDTVLFAVSGTDKRYHHKTLQLLY